MTQIASLGAEIRTEGIAQGTAALQTFVSAAAKAESAAGTLGASGAKTSAGLSAAADSAKKAEASVTKLAAADKVLSQGMATMQAEARKVSSSLAAVGASSSATVASMEKLGAAAGVASNAIGAGGDGAKKFSDGLKPLNDNVKLTSNQVLNLTRQGGDMATMWAMGAGPMQIFTSQAAQLYDAIASGPGGLTGGLKAMGGSLLALATPTNLAVAGLVAAGGAALYFGTRADTSVKTAEQALSSYKALLDSLELGYAKAGKAAEDAFKLASAESPIVARADIFGTRDEIRASLAAETEQLVAQTQTLASTKIRTFADLTPDVLAAQERIRELGLSLKNGEITAAQFRQEISLMRMDEKVPRSVIEIVDGLRLSSINARDLANALQAVEAAAGAAAEKTGRLRIPGLRDDVAKFGSASGLMGRMDPEGYGALVEGLKSQADALTKPLEKAEKAEDRQLATRMKVLFSVEHTVRALRIEAQTLDMSKGAAAAFRAEMEGMARLREAMGDTGGVVDPAEVARIKEAATEIGRLTQAIDIRTLAQQASEKRASLFQPDRENAIAASLRACDIGEGYFDDRA